MRVVRVEAPSDAETEREGEVMQRERDLERRVAELEEDNRRLREAIRKADRRLDDLASVPLGPAAAVVVEAHLYLKGAIRQPAPEIAELEAENRRLREALDDLNMHGIEVGANIMVPRIDWDAAFARAALSPEAKE